MHTKRSQFLFIIANECSLLPIFVFFADLCLLHLQLIGRLQHVKMTMCSACIADSVTVLFHIGAKFPLDKKLKKIRMYRRAALLHNAS